MGRGLSDLQLDILAIAATNYKARLERGEKTKLDDTDVREILASIFGWRQTKSNWAGGRRFDPSLIGLRKYATVHASVSRALTRLEIRGLIRRVYRTRSYCGGAIQSDEKWTGIHLTAAGIDAGCLLIESGYRLSYSKNCLT